VKKHWPIEGIVIEISLRTQMETGKEKNVLSRHEPVNRGIKQFRCMNHVFRHALNLHPTFFHAVVNLTQIMIENGEPLYEVHL